MSGFAAPRQCPVCGDTLALTRLGCRSCGTELSGSFEACQYCSLGGDDRELLGVFLSSRGNIKELERHLGVSYPTARARFEALLVRLGLVGDADEGGPAQSGPAGEIDVLARLAAGEIDVDTAEQLIGGSRDEETKW
jgi:hypothetical protein